MHKKPLPKHYQDFRDALLAWFKDYQRDMPWRRTEDPYRIWVSEVMLQQTQVKKVVGYYERFIARFPDVQHLAAAPLQDVLKVWEGLGYYARARNLHKAAQVIVDELDGKIPVDYATFRKLPGVGDYSAAAVQSIAFDAPYAAVDGNIKRVLARLFLMEAPINDTKSAKVFQQQADDLLDPNAPGFFNQAMMELGAMVCRPQSPTCLVCPVNSFCEAFHTARQDEFPYRRETKPVPEHHLAVGVIYKRQQGFTHTATTGRLARRTLGVSGWRTCRGRDCRDGLCSTHRRCCQPLCYQCSVFRAGQACLHPFQGCRGCVSVRLSGG